VDLTFKEKKKREITQKGIFFSLKRKLYLSNILFIGAQEKIDPPIFMEFLFVYFQQGYSFVTKILVFLFFSEVT